VEIISDYILLTVLFVQTKLTGKETLSVYFSIFWRISFCIESRFKKFLYKNFHYPVIAALLLVR